MGVGQRVNKLIDKLSPRIAMIGPPGSGKSTVARLLHEQLDQPIISPGNVLRNPDQYPWVEPIIRNYDVHSGELLSDAKLVLIVMQLIEQSKQNYRGWIMDGMPRQIGQYNAMMEYFRPTHFVLFDDPDFTVTTRRLQKRKEDGGRKDDDPEIAQRRREIYTELTGPVVRRVRNLRRGPGVHSEGPSLKVIDIRVRDDNPPERVADLIRNCL